MREQTPSSEMSSAMLDMMRGVSSPPVSVALHVSTPNAKVVGPPHGRLTSADLVGARSDDLVDLDDRQLDRGGQRRVTVQQLHLVWRCGLDIVADAVPLAEPQASSRGRGRKGGLRDGSAKVVDMDWRMRC